MICAEIIEELEKLAPGSLAMNWDNPGLLAGDAGEEVQRVFLALDAGSEAVRAAAEADCQMLITHHPLIFSPLKAVRADHFIGKRLIQMIRAGISYYAMHTNFDIAVMGQLCMERLGIPFERPLELTSQDPDMGIGGVGDLPSPVSLQVLAEQVRREFDLPPVRIFGDLTAQVSRIAVCPGSGKGMTEHALAAGAQVLVTGDVDHHFGIDSLEEGLFVIDAGHHGLEHVFTDYMKQWFSEKFPQIGVVTDSSRSPFSVI